MPFVWRYLVYPSVSSPVLCKQSLLAQLSTVTPRQLDPRSRSYTLPWALQLEEPHLSIPL